SFASICRRVCDSNAARPLGREGERREANAMSEAVPSGTSALSAFSFLRYPTHPPTTSRKYLLNHFVISQPKQKTPEPISGTKPREEFHRTTGKQSVSSINPQNPPASPPALPEKCISP
ncbi:hypothetical protein O0S10_07655, partial [Methanocorpusculum sp. MG]